MDTHLKRDLRLTALWVVGLVLIIALISMLSCAAHKTGASAGVSVLEQPWAPFGDGFPSEAQISESPEGAAAIEETNEVVPIYFDYDKHNIRNNQVLSAIRNAEILFRRNEKRVIIEGHCDERGTIEYNLVLGIRRSETVRRFFVRMGINPNSIMTVSYGKERPVDTDHDESAWAKNRRVVIRIP